MGSFEIDGNRLDNSAAGEPIDWEPVDPPNVTHFDDGTGSTDDSFNTGSKETEPGGWDCQTASAPGKDDIVSGDIAFRTFGTAPNRDQFVYVDYFRAAVNGDAHIDYEFNQGTLPNPACPALPRRTNGDIIISFDTEQGGKKIFVRAFRWAFTGTSTTVGTLTELRTGSKGATFDGAVNIPPGGLTIPGHANGDFGEAALNLTQTIGNIACGQFATAYMKSRASTSISAALKDRTATKPVNVGECPRSGLAKAVRNVTAGEAFTATGPTSTNASPGNTLEYRLTYSNTGTAAATNVMVTDTLDPKQTLAPGACTTAVSNCSYNATTRTLTWTLGTVAAGAGRVLTFQVTLDASFPAGPTTIRNVGTVDTDEEPPKNSPPTTVTVTANPNSAQAKAVRNVTDLQQFTVSGPTSTSAKPGDTLEYRLTYTNGGNAPATGVTVTDILSAKQTLVPASCSMANNCAYTAATRTVTFNLGTVPAGESRVRTFQVTLDASFPAGPTTISNVATVVTDQEPAKDSNTTTVTVTASPNSALVKSVRNVSADQAFTATGPSSTSAVPGNVIEYRLVYTNGGNAPASGVVVTDTIQARQTYVSCTAGCVPNGEPPTGVTWNLGTVAAGASVTMTFQVRLDASFPAGPTPVRNTGVVDTAEEPAKNSNETVVTVTANPVSALVKSVRNFTDSGEFANSASAKPDDVIEYRLVYTNGGNADATNVVVTDTLAAKQTLVPATCTLQVNSCSYNAATRTLTWTLGTVAAGASRAVTFQVTLDASFPAGSTLVRNTGSVDTAQEDPKNSNETVVTVTARTDLVPSKVAGVFGADRRITYTISYVNNGNAPATSTVITDELPAGTTFVSCTGGTSCGNNSGTVTWQVGTVPAGGSGSVTVTVQVTDVSRCTVCNTASIASPDQNGGTPVSTGTPVCVIVTPEDNPAGANSRGSATGALVHVPLLTLDQTLPADATPNPAHDHTSVDSSRSGLGAPSSESAQQLAAAVPPPDGSVVTAEVLKAVTTSKVTGLPGAVANTTSVATSGTVNVLAGAVTATLVRGVADATATGNSATVSSAGSVIEGLTVMGAPVQFTGPGQIVDLPDALFGANSRVVLYERVPSTTTPPGTSGGTYTADLTVNMIHVFATTPALGVVDVIVSQAVAHADFPQTTVCGLQATRSVSGNALILDAQVDPLEASATHGFVEIPASGTAVPATATLSSVTVGTNRIRSGSSSSTGTVGATSTTATSKAEAKTVCLLEDLNGCLIEARAATSTATSMANSTSRSSSATTDFAGLAVRGTPASLLLSVPVNTTITLPGGIGFVILNEQVCDNGGTLTIALPTSPTGTCAGDSITGHTGITVRAIHIVLNTGVEIIVAEAHADALWN